MRKSFRYQKIKKKIANKSYFLNEGLQFLQNNNPEKLKNIKASFALNWAQQKQKNMLKGKIILPHPFPVKGKIAVVKDDLPADIAESLAKNKVVELLSVEEVHQRVVADNKEKTRKRSHWGFEKLLVPPQSEKKFRSPEKLPPKIFGFIARKVLITENVLKAVENFQKGELEARTDKGGNIHAVIGKSSFPLPHLAENYQSLHSNIISWKPAKWRGEFLKSATLSTTMGPGLKIEKQTRMATN